MSGVSIKKKKLFFFYRKSSDHSVLKTPYTKVLNLILKKDTKINLSFYFINYYVFIKKEFYLFIIGD